MGPPKVPALQNGSDSFVRFLNALKATQDALKTAGVNFDSPPYVEAYNRSRGLMIAHTQTVSAQHLLSSYRSFCTELCDRDEFSESTAIPVLALGMTPTAED